MNITVNRAFQEQDSFLIWLFVTLVDALSDQLLYFFGIFSYFLSCRRPSRQKSTVLTSCSMTSLRATQTTCLFSPIKVTPDC